MRSLKQSIGFMFMVFAASGAIAQVTPGIAPRTAPAVDHVPVRLIDRADYEDRLRAFWLGEVIANWTGRITEGCCCPSCPGGGDFLTDADWGGQTPGGKTIDFVLDQDPWLADDDTDIEYIYQYLLEQHDLPLTPAQVRDGWSEHINRFIWVSNERARELMAEGVLPPSTSLASANQHHLMIDAQLTTEVFGVYCPGMPARALELAHLPIRTTASGFAAHAAQSFIVMHALALMIPEDLTGDERLLWLIEQGRTAVPETSKTADVIDFVTGWYLAHPDGPWEDCRDAIYVRYELEDDANGFNYRGWYESSVNYATAIMALLYGGEDYKRTVQIATLSGWDSDNPAATLGGLLGLMLGYEELVDQFPDVALSDRFEVKNTRDAIFDHLPDDDEAEDTFSMLAARQLDVVDRALGTTSRVSGADIRYWVVPAYEETDLWAVNPLNIIDDASANNHVLRQGGSVSGASSVDSSPPGPSTTYGTSAPQAFAQGYALNFAGIELPYWIKFYSTQNAGASIGDWQTLTVTYDRPVEIAAVRFIEGNHFHLDAQADGGYFLSASDPDASDDPFIELRIGGTWIAPSGVTMSEALDSGQPFQIIDFVLIAPETVTGVRISGQVGGLDAFVTIADLDGLRTYPVPE
jgi:hypothetical protein